VRVYSRTANDWISSPACPRPRRVTRRVECLRRHLYEALEHTYRCSARPVKVRQGAARCGQVRPGAARCGRVRRGAARCGQVRPGAARCGQVRTGAARCGRVRLGAAGCGSVRPGAARCGRVLLGEAGCVTSFQGESDVSRCNGTRLSSSMQVTDYEGPDERQTRPGLCSFSYRGR
jgi:hypothetical protein